MKRAAIEIGKMKMLNEEKYYPFLLPGTRELKLKLCSIKSFVSKH